MPLQAVEYHVIRGSNVTQLSMSVNTAINDGFQPLGGVAIGVNGAGDALLLQAVVKYQDVPDEEVGVSHIGTYAMR